MHQKKDKGKTNLTNKSKSGQSAYFRHVFARGEKQKDLANGGEETKSQDKKMQRRKEDGELAYFDRFEGLGGLSEEHEEERWRSIK